MLLSARTFLVFALALILGGPLFGSGFQESVNSWDEVEEQIKGKKLKNLFIKGVEFDGEEGASFKGLELSNITFINCKFEGVSFDDAKLYKVIFAWPTSEFSNTSFDRANFENVSFINLIPEDRRKKSITSARFRGANLEGLQVYEDTERKPISDSQRQRLVETLQEDGALNIANINWGTDEYQLRVEDKEEFLAMIDEDYQLRHILAHEVDLSGVDLSNLFVADSQINDCKLEGTRFIDTFLMKVRFEGKALDLQGAIFDYASFIEEVDFVGVTDALLKASFRDADLRGMRIAGPHYSKISRKQKEELLDFFKRQGANYVDRIEWLVAE